jgi:hypothetical protein
MRLSLSFQARHPGFPFSSSPQGRISFTGKSKPDAVLPCRQTRNARSRRGKNYMNLILPSQIISKTNFADTSM